jgi:hypothetical protein
MTIWFDKPNAAFHASELSLMRPIARPAPRDTPSLWSRAKAMFGVMLDKARTVTQLAVRWRLSRTERREILTRLKPVEKLTRQLIIAEAATFLLMTPDGMKLRRDARIMALPARAAPQPPPKGALITGSRRLALFDPRTLAVLHPNAPTPAIKPSPHDASDPTTWRCSFKVMRLVHPENDDAPPPPPKKPSGPRPRAFSYDDIVALTPKPRRQGPERETSAGPSIARRVEALPRVLAKPDRAIRRIARFLASLPREALDPPDPAWVSTHGWYHGRPEFSAACDIAVCALTLFYRLRLADFDGPQPEPG